MAPLLSSKCLRCHHGDHPAGELSLEARSDLVNQGYLVPGSPEASFLLDVVTTPEGSLRPSMPKDGAPLSEEELAHLRDWIAAGADWPDHMRLQPASRINRDWWSLQPIVAGEPPSVDSSAWPEWEVHPIDRFILQALQEQGLSPNPPADRRTLVRRVTYDLTGLPPTPAEINAYLEDQSSEEEAYARLIDRLLDSPRYGEHWGRHWLDVVRFGESNGFERNVLINTLWPFRDYVIRSFNEDRPFDQLVREHLAGDVLAPNDPARVVGTSFLVCGPYDNVGNQDAVQAAIIRADTIDEIIRAAGEAFLGMTVGCARCHDHKFDPILQSDYYTLYSVFAGVQHGDRQVGTAEEQERRERLLQPLMVRRQELQQVREALQASIDERAEGAAGTIESTWIRPPVNRVLTEETFPPVKARFVRLSVENCDNNPHVRTGFRIDEFEVFNSRGENVALASRGATAEGASRTAGDFAGAYGPDLTIDGRYGAHWLATGHVLTIRLPGIETIERIAFSSDRQRMLDPAHHQTTFVGDYRIHVSRDGETWTEVAHSFERQPPSPTHRLQRLRQVVMSAEDRESLAALDREIAEVQREIDALPPLPVWWIGQFHAAPGPFPIFLGGDPQRRGDEISQVDLLWLASLRSELEYSPELPESRRRLLLAEWIVHPDNPLTSRVLANRLWHYHFGTGLVDTPSDFGAMGSLPSHPELLDWLAGQVFEHGWKLKPLHRLILLSQTYRQSSDYRAQAADVDADNRLLWRFPPRRLSGEELRDSMLSVAGLLKLEQTGGPGFRLYQYLEDNVATYVPLDVIGEETYRRAVYHQNARAARVDVMSDFDCPDPAFATPRRAATTTPLQALTLLNHPFTVDVARALAVRLRQEGGDDAASQVSLCWELLFSRPPQAEELARSVEFLEATSLVTFCRAVLNTNEFLYVN